MKNIEHLIDEALKTEPSFRLRDEFKDRVIIVIKHKEKTNQIKFYLGIIFGIIVILSLGYATLHYFMPSTLERLKGVKTISQLIPMSVLVASLMIIIQFLDTQLVKKYSFFQLNHPNSKNSIIKI